MDSSNKNKQKKKTLFLDEDSATKSSSSSSSTTATTTNMTFHQQSPRFMNSSMNSTASNSQSPSASPRQMTSLPMFSSSPMSSPRQSDSSQLVFKTEKSFFAWVTDSLAAATEQTLPNIFEKILQKLFSEQSQLQSYSISAFLRVITPFKALLKVKNAQTATSLLNSLLPFFQKALSSRNLNSVQDLLKISLIYTFEFFPGAEKSLASSLDLFTKMLQIPSSTSQESELSAISNGVQRLVLLNIQNICASSTQIASAIQPELLLIFKRIYELILHFFTTKPTTAGEGSQYHFLRFLATLLRTGTTVLTELKANKSFQTDTNNAKLLEKVFVRIFKYLFIGNPTFHTVIFGSTELNSSTMNTSQPNQSLNTSFSMSECSENDEASSTIERTRIEQVQAKIRNQTCLLLQAVIRDFPLILKNQWQLLIKSNHFTKEFIASIKHQAKPMHTTTTITDVEPLVRPHSLLYPNFMEISLLSSLVFEEEKHIKQNVLSLLCSVIELLPSKALFSGLDVAKASGLKSKSTSSFTSQSYLIYSAYRNIHFTLLHLLQTISQSPLSTLHETKLPLCSAISKVYISFLTSTLQFDKMPQEEGIELFLNQALTIFSTTEVALPTEPLLLLRINIISVLNCLAKTSTRFVCLSQLFSEVRQEMPTDNLFHLCTSLVDDVINSQSNSNNKQPSIMQRNPNPVDSATSTNSNTPAQNITLLNLKESLALEAIQLLKNGMLHYLDCLLIQVNSQFVIWDHLSTFINKLENQSCERSKKILPCLYEFVEEVAGQRRKILESNSDLDQTDDKHEDNSNANQQQQQQQSSSNAIISIDLVSEFETTIFDKFLIEKTQKLMEASLKDSFSSTSSTLISGLSLCSYITNQQWIQHSNMTTLLTQVLASTPSSSFLRFQLLKTLSALSFCPIFSSNIKYSTQLIALILRENSSGSTSSRNASKSDQQKVSNNLIVTSKLSQSIANWCYNISDNVLNSLPVDLLGTLFTLISEFAGSPKDKIAPHGLRSIGLFLMKLSNATCTKLRIQNQSDRICKLIAANVCHQKSPKIVWNACVAVSNIFENSSVAFFSAACALVFSQSLQHVLNTKTNDKSASYALRALASIWLNLASPLKVEQLLPGLLDLLSTLVLNGSSSIGDHSEEVHFFMKLVKRVHVELKSTAAESLLIELVQQKSYQLVSSLSKYVIDLWKSSGMEQLATLHKEHSLDPEEEKFAFNLSSKVVKQGTDRMEEARVRGQDGMKIIQFDLLGLQANKPQSNLDSLNLSLSELKEVAIILLSLIDNNEDLCVSMSMYDHIKDLAAINLSAPVIKISLL